MQIEHIIELPTGTIKFVGDLTQDELDYIVKLGLVTLYLRGELDAVVSTEDGTIISDVPEQLQ